MTRRLLVVTEHRPHASRPDMSWEANLQPWHKGDPIGYGPTEGDAVADLYHQIAEREDDDEERHELYPDPDLALEQKRDDELWEKLK